LTHFTEDTTDHYSSTLLDELTGPSEKQSMLLGSTSGFCDFVQMQVCYEIMTPYSCYGQHFL